MGIWSGISIPPAQALNSVASSASDRGMALAAQRQIAPLTYGEDRLTGLLLNVLPHGTDGTLLIVQVLWGHALSGISELLLNDLGLPAGSSFTHYLGDQVAQDVEMFFAMQKQGIAYTVNLKGFAYSVIKIPVKAFTGQLNFTAKIRGRRLYDPRKDSTAGGTGTHRLSDPATWEWNDCPALAFADWTTNKVYGAGRPVVWSSVAALADANDQLVGTGTKEKRRLIGLTLNSSAEVKVLSEAMRAYAGCWAVPTVDGIKFVPDADAAPVDDIDHDDGDIMQMTSLKIRDVLNAPTVVEVIYTDTTKNPYRDGSATAQLPGVGSTRPMRVSQVRMPGVQRYSQAMREAIERLNKLTLADMSTSVDVADEGIKYQVADIVRLSHPVGLVKKPMRITDAVMTGLGRWRLQLQEHDPAAYSDEVQTQATIPDTSFNNPAGPPAQVTGVSAAVSTLLITLKRTPTTDVSFKYTSWEYSTNGGVNYSPIPAVPINDGRAGATWQTSLQGALRIRARDVDVDGLVGPYSQTYDFTVGPEIQPVAATVPTLGIKINADVFGPGVNYSEAYVHGFDASGAAADVDGSIRLNGVSKPVARGLLYGSQGPVSCVIVLDTSGAGFLIAGNGLTRPYAIARRYAGAWQYDNNSVWTTFTPTAAHCVIGQIEVGGPDTGNPGTPPGILVATMLSEALLLSSIPSDSPFLSQGDALNSDPYVQDPSKWVVRGTGAVDFRPGPTTAVGAKGSAYLSAEGAGERQIFDWTPIPADPTQTYSYLGNLYAAAQNDRNMYLVVRMFRPDDSEYGGIGSGATGWGGTFAGYTFGGQPPVGQWTVQGGDFGAGTARPIPADVSHFRIGVWFQYAQAGSSSVQQAAQYLRLTNVTGARAAAATAASAQAAAAIAQANATSALGMLNAMRSNGVLDASEKPALIKTWQQIAGERVGIVNQANNLGIVAERDEYTYRFDVVDQYLSAMWPAWNDTTQDTYITPAVDQQNWLNFYNARQALLNRITAILKQIADLAQGTANSASTAAANAQAAASNAQASATQALSLLSTMRSNGYIDASEKPALIKLWNEIYNERPTLELQANEYGLTTEWANYWAQYVQLSNYLGSLSPAWDNTATDTPIVPATDQSYWSTFFYQRNQLRQAIAIAAGKVANWTGVKNRPKAITVKSRGYYTATTGAPVGFSSGVFDVDTGQQIAGGGRSYRIVVFNRDGSVFYNEFYDVYGNGAASNGRNAASMAADLNYIASAPEYNNKVLVVFADDEPFSNRTAALVAAMKLNGASSAIFERRVVTHGAYILIALCGCGEGNGAESYGGEFHEDPDGWCELSFELQNGTFRISGDVAGARSVYDIGYLGAIDATTNKFFEQEGMPSGAPEGSFWRVPSTRRWYQLVNGVWQPSVGPGSVGTGELENEAAAALRRSTNTSSVNLLAGGYAAYTINQFTYTAVADCTVVVRLNGSIEHFSGYGSPGGSSVFKSFARITTDGSYFPTGVAGNGDSALSGNSTNVDPYSTVPIYLEERFSMTTGQTLTFYARAAQSGNLSNVSNGGGSWTYIPGAICSVRAGNQLLVEVIKK